MKTSAAGRKALAKHEGNELVAYQDSVGVWTIGVGHTAAAGPPAPKRGMKITAEQSDEILARDLPQYERAVESAIKRPMTQNQFEAMVSLCFNVGVGNFQSSSIVKRFNAGDVQGAADAFLKWNKAGGKVLKGLTTRRQAERALFLKGAAITYGIAAVPKPDVPPDDDPPETTVVQSESPDEDDIVAKASTWDDIQGKLASANTMIDQAQIAKDSSIVRVGQRVVRGAVGAGGTAAGGLVVAAAADDQQQGFWASFIGWLDAIPGLLWLFVVFALLGGMALMARFFINKRVLMQKQGVVLPTPSASGRKIP